MAICALARATIEISVFGNWPTQITGILKV